MKIEDIKTKEQLLEFFDTKYGGKKAIKKEKIPQHYKRSMGRQYYSAAQSKAVLDGD